MSIAISESWGDQNNFDDLFKVHYKRIFKFVRLRVGNAFDADEITNDCFLNIFSYNKKKIKNHKAFLYKTAKNGIIDFYRKRNISRSKF